MYSTLTGLTGEPVAVVGVEEPFRNNHSCRESKCAQSGGQHSIENIRKRDLRQRLLETGTVCLIHSTCVARVIGFRRRYSRHHVFKYLRAHKASAIARLKHAQPRSSYALDVMVAVAAT